MTKHVLPTPTSPSKIILASLQGASADRPRDALSSAVGENLLCLYGVQCREYGGGNWDISRVFLELFSLIVTRGN